MRKEAPAPAESDRFAAGRGICGQCYLPIEIGERFRWRGSGTGLMPVCDRCLMGASAKRTAVTKERK